jgi:SAM-dependent methyltransferase
MWETNYLLDMQSYYDNSSHAAYAKHGGVFADEYDARYATDGDGLRELMVFLQDQMRGRRVLEVACGHGRWTRYVARTAESILATDNSPRMLAQAAELIHHRNPLPPGRVELREWDAMAMGKLSEKFNGAFHVNFFDHLPRSIHQTFLAGFHSCIASGSPVVMAVNKLTAENRKNLYSKAGSLDKYLRRERPDGSTYEIIDNEMDEAELTAAVGVRGRNFKFTHGKNLAWLAYKAA